VAARAKDHHSCVVPMFRRLISTSLMMMNSDENSGVSGLADYAVDQGLVVFAPAGNSGCNVACSGTTCSSTRGNSIAAPANAHKVLGDRLAYH
jgi:hypothetical protein